MREKNYCKKKMTAKVKAYNNNNNMDLNLRMIRVSHGVFFKGWGGGWWSGHSALLKENMLAGRGHTAGNIAFCNGGSIWSMFALSALRTACTHNDHDYLSLTRIILILWTRICLYGACFSLDWFTVRFGSLIPVFFGGSWNRPQSLTISICGYGNTTDTHTKTHIHKCILIPLKIGRASCRERV